MFNAKAQRRKEVHAERGFVFLQATSSGCDDHVLASPFAPLRLCVAKV